MDRSALTPLVTYVTPGTASNFFMDYGADDENRWTMKTMYEGLFNYFFPTEFKDRLCTHLSQSVQKYETSRNRDVSFSTSRMASQMFHFPSTDWLKCVHK